MSPRRGRAVLRQSTADTELEGSGNRTYGTIKRFADIDIQRQLDRLLSIGLVERHVPVTAGPSRTKQVVYRIADNFLAFWFRFVYRHRADIARGLGDEVVRRVIMPGLIDYLGEPWEELCREHVRQLAARGDLPTPVSSVGRWWSTDGSTEIDVGLNGKTVVLAGSVKWSRSVGRDELDRLRRATEALPNRATDMTFALFAREQVRDVDPRDALTFTAADLYR